MESTIFPRLKGIVVESYSCCDNTFCLYSSPLSLVIRYNCALSPAKMSSTIKNSTTSFFCILIVNLLPESLPLPRLLNILLRISFPVESESLGRFSNPFLELLSENFIRTLFYSSTAKFSLNLISHLHNIIHEKSLSKRYSIRNIRNLLHIVIALAGKSDDLPLLSVLHSQLLDRYPLDLFQIYVAANSAVFLIVGQLQIV